MLVIAMTGGIGAGKSTAVDLFKQYGVPVIDTDIIARQLVENDQVVLKEIASQFGTEILDENQNLDRARLRQIIFNDEHKRELLQNILHPRIHKQVLESLQSLQSEYCIIVIPLLAETKHEYPYDRVLLIDADEATQVERTMKRDNNSKALIDKILSAQASREQRRAIADDIIDNSGTIEELQLQVAALHKQYQEMARS
jgi:dephospho-CoA kinase